MAEERRRENDARLDQILAHLKAQDERLDEKLEPVNKMLADHHKKIYGNGEAGYEKRIDRLEQSSKTRNWILGGISAPVLASIGLKIWDLLTKNGQ